MYCRFRGLSCRFRDRAAQPHPRVGSVERAWRRNHQGVTDAPIAAVASANGDPALIRPTTFVTHEPGAAPALGVLHAPENLHATTGDFPGHVDPACGVFGAMLRTASAGPTGRSAHIERCGKP